MSAAANYRPTWVRRTTQCVLVAIVAWMPCGSADSRAEDAVPAHVKVPPGFVVEVAAGPPLVQHPMMAGFDDRGRLYVADNAGMNLNAEELLDQRPNLIRRLEDTDGDGRFDRSTVFADEMTFPMGALWHEGAIYVASPPHIWRLEDTTGDGVADRREPIVGRFGFVGNAADIHGCFLGPDGRIYWCDGRHGHEFVDGEGRSLSKGQAARIFSCREDGSDIQVYCGGGMDNPVEVAFTAEGEMLGTMTFYNPDDARHDALVHYAYGGVYPRRHPVTAEFKRTGDFMPPLSLFGVVAPAGLTRYESDQWGADYRDNFFSVQFNTHKVVRHVLTRSGASFRSADEDFLTSDNPDFHPTDVFEDADGSLLVIDTGGWFRNGCPTSQVAKPEILGAIYRVRRLGSAPPVDPRGLAMSWDAASPDALCHLLDDARPAVRQRAVAELARRDVAAVSALQNVVSASDSPPARRQQAVWALCRIAANTTDGRALAVLREALSDADPGVLLPAIRSLASIRDRAAVSPLLPLLSHPDLAVQREAATALGRTGDSTAIPALLAALSTAHDRFVEHAVIYALIEIDDPGPTRAGLAAPQPQIRRGALIALDQMDHGGLTRDEVIPLLDTDDQALQQSAWEVVSRHESWASESIDRLTDWLTADALSGEELALARGTLSALQQNPAIEGLIGEQLARADQSRENQRLLLNVIARSSRQSWPEAWTQPVEKLLLVDDDQVVSAALGAMDRLGTQPFHDVLHRVSHDAHRSISVRRAAVVQRAKSTLELDESEFALLIGGLDAELDPLTRLAAADALAIARLKDSQRRQLADELALAGPLELPLLLATFESGGDAELGHALIAAIERAPGRAALDSAMLRAVLQAFPPTCIEKAEGLLASLARDESVEAARLISLSDQFTTGDATRGRAVFFGSRAACAACHRAGPEGGSIGPDLSTIGEVRTERDLLEAIVLPSKTLARGYESWSVTTLDGHAHVGVITSEGPDALQLRTTDRSEIRIPRDSIDELAPSPLSIMPQGLDQVLSLQELQDLIAFLRAQR